MARAEDLPRDTPRPPSLPRCVECGRTPTQGHGGGCSVGPLASCGQCSAPLGERHSPACDSVLWDGIPFGSRVTFDQTLLAEQPTEDRSPIGPEST